MDFILERFFNFKYFLKYFIKKIKKKKFKLIIKKKKNSNLRQKFSGRAEWPLVPLKKTLKFFIKIPFQE
jgi:hypothetical protein